MTEEKFHFVTHTLLSYIHTLLLFLSCAVLKESRSILTWAATFTMKIMCLSMFAALLALTCAQKAQLILDTDPKEQLLTACQTGEKTEVVMALTNGADINAKDMVSHILSVL